jgi:hypothetical protein
MRTSGWVYEVIISQLRLFASDEVRRCEAASKFSLKTITVADCLLRAKRLKESLDSIERGHGGQ